MKERQDAGVAALDEAVALAFRILKGLMLVLVVLFVFWGFYRVQPNEVAFESWLGRLSDEPRQSGGHLTLPLVGRVVRVDMRTREAVLDSFDVVRTPEELASGRLAPREGGLDPGHDGYLVTGDANLVHLALHSRVKVGQPREFLVGARDPQALVTVLLERAAVRVAAHSEVGSLIGAGKADFTRALTRELRESLDAEGVRSGLAVEGVELERSVTPPAQVQDAFDAVSEAVQTGDKLRTQARSKAAETEGDARSQAARIASRARSDAGRVRVDAEADRQVFDSLRGEWARDPAGLRQRLLVDALAESLDKVEEVFLVTDGELRVRMQRDASARAEELAKEAKEATQHGY